MSAEPVSERRDLASTARALARNWQSALVLAVIGLLYTFVAGPLRVPSTPLDVLVWAAAAILVFSVGPLLLDRPGVRVAARILGLVVTAAITLVIINSVGSLALLPSAELPAGRDLFLNAALIWLQSVLVFTLWFWQIDGGGPHRRSQRPYQVTDFAFPQFQLDEPALREGWQPNILDYLFLSFTTSTAFGPADTIVVSRRAKVLMMVEALISLVVIGVLVGRAVGQL
jgi:hypothetical protein